MQIGHQDCCNVAKESGLGAGAKNGREFQTALVDRAHGGSGSFSDLLLAVLNAGDEVTTVALPTKRC